MSRFRVAPFARYRYGGRRDRNILTESYSSELSTEYIIALSLNLCGQDYRGLQSLLVSWLELYLHTLPLQIAPFPAWTEKGSLRRQSGTVRFRGCHFRVPPHSPVYIALGTQQPLELRKFTLQRATTKIESNPHLHIHAIIQG